MNKAYYGPNACSVCVQNGARTHGQCPIKRELDVAEWYTVGAGIKGAWQAAQDAILAHLDYRER